ncbi:MAG: rhomboid family intramembrane serine protease [Verrucomicrobiota bacterium]
MASPLMVLGLGTRPSGEHLREWRGPALIILGAAGLAWFVRPDRAGHFSAVIWLGLLFWPSLAMRRMAELILDRRFRAAARWADATVIFHPSAQFRAARRAIHLARDGKEEAARREVVSIKKPTMVARALELILTHRPSTGTHYTAEKISTFAFARGRKSIGSITPMVAVIIAANVLMFLAEIVFGGSTNPLTLHRLGQLEFSAIQYQGEYWRLVTALFLHYGPLHLLFNLYALFVIGPGLEEAIGPVRFAICYLLAGLGSGLGVLLLHYFDLTSAEQLVGASGCVMGLVGAWAGLLVRQRRAPWAGRRLKNILIIIVIQTAFDLSTPQISMAAHMSGLLTGVALGLILAPRSLRA